jgi:hypothetical protein
MKVEVVVENNIGFPTELMVVADIVVEVKVVVAVGKLVEVEVEVGIVGFG